MTRDPRYICSECKVGTLRVGDAFYFTFQDGQPICVPDFPAWVCDVCGRREYDPEAVADLHAILEMKPGLQRKLSQPRTFTDQDQSTTSVDPQRRA
jgi:YgiT-type zinc finger domain-containing protein